MTLWPVIELKTDGIGGIFALVTPAARSETEGDTERAELAQVKCQYAWRDYPHVSYHGPDGDESIYRQHRCGRDLDHKGRCRCRYCSEER